MNPQQARDNAIDAVEQHADPRLILMIDAVIAEFNAAGVEWSANDIRGRLPVAAAGLVGARVKAASMRRPVEMRRVGWVLSDLPSTKSKPIGRYRGAQHPETLFDEVAAS